MNIESADMDTLIEAFKKNNVACSSSDESWCRLPDENDYGISFAYREDLNGPRIEEIDDADIVDTIYGDYANANDSVGANDSADANDSMNANIGANAMDANNYPWSHPLDNIRNELRNIKDTVCRLESMISSLDVRQYGSNYAVGAEIAAMRSTVMSTVGGRSIDTPINMLESLD